MQFGSSKSNRKKTLLSADSGQMTVELAVCIPVIFVLVAISYNLLTFMGYCAAFDRLVEINVEQLATSPAASDYAPSQLEVTIHQNLSEQLSAPDDEVQLSVQIEALPTQNGVDATLNLIMPQEQLTAKLAYQGWFFGATIFNFTVPGLEHEKSVVYSPYRPGVVV